MNWLIYNMNFEGVDIYCCWRVSKIPGDACIEMVVEDSIGRGVVLVMKEILIFM
jgi:hypothetical protein